MSRYRIEESIVDTDKSVWHHTFAPRPGTYGKVTDTICRSARGRWYVVHDHSWSEDNRVIDYAEWLSPEEAARRLLTAIPELPDYPELRQAADNISE